MSGEVGLDTMEKEKWVADDSAFLQLPQSCYNLLSYQMKVLE